MPDGPRNGLLWAETSDIAGVIGERWRESLKSELQSKTSISQTKQQGVLAELVKENLLTRGYERGGSALFPVLSHRWLGGWVAVVGGRVDKYCSAAKWAPLDTSQTPVLLHSCKPTPLHCCNIAGEGGAIK